jgi:hypothetical protein
MEIWRFDDAAREIHAIRDINRQDMIDGYVPKIVARIVSGSVADGQLIAAAPELLEACEAAFHFLSSEAPTPWGQKKSSLKLLQAAIAKATTSPAHA